ncbi:MAG: capsular biosynthesis protein [Actinobacteria bacterium]|nr:capsular biosynthesis protein [Actinomycetota bacterium]
MRIVIDLDGVICPIKKAEQSYSDLKPLPGAVERLRELKKSGHYIIIMTARHMATCDSNVGKVMKKMGKLTFDWLEKYGIEYDEVYFGKPNAEVYIDDRAIRFTSWSNISNELLEQRAKLR